MNFTLEDENEDISELTHYTKELKYISETEDFTLNVDCEHLYQFDATLYN